MANACGQPSLGREAASYFQPPLGHLPTSGAATEKWVHQAQQKLCCSSQPSLKTWGSLLCAPSCSAGSHLPTSCDVLSKEGLWGCWPVMEEIIHGWSPPPDHCKVKTNLTAQQKWWILWSVLLPTRALLCHFREREKAGEVENSSFGS